MFRRKPAQSALAILVALTLLLSACSSKKTGTVEGLVWIRERPNELLARIKLEDGTEIIAFPKAPLVTGSGSGWELVKKGQVVEVEPVKDSKDWKIVRIISRPPGDTAP